MGILDGIRVLDFGRYVAGPWCAALLGDLGAEVIRIEKRAGSEDRFVGPVADGGEGALFLQTNRNKKGMTLDPAKPAGREVVRRLVATADVVVANLPPQSLRSLGLDWETLSKLRPSLVLTTISAFGAGGPYEERLGFDGIGQAMSGAMYLSGHPGEPMKAGWASTSRRRCCRPPSASRTHRSSSSACASSTGSRRAIAVRSRGPVTRSAPATAGCSRR